MLDNNKAHIGLKRWLRLQLIVMLLLVLSIYLIYGQPIAYGFAVGCIIFILPTYCFARQFFSQTGAQAAKRVVRRFYRAEALKLMFTAALFVLAFAWLDVAGLPCFAGLMTMQLIHWLTITPVFNV